MMCHRQIIQEGLKKKTLRLDTALYYLLHLNVRNIVHSILDSHYQHLYTSKFTSFGALSRL